MNWKYAVEFVGRISVPEGMENLVSDYRINVFEIGRLGEEKIRKFTSDFQVVADFVTQMHEEKEYTPSEKPIRHIDGVMNLLQALTQNTQYTESVEVMKQMAQEKGAITMRDPLREASERGEKRGEKRGEERGRQQACEDMAKAMFKEANYSKDTIIRITKLSQSRVDELEKEVMARV